jgi:signal-transduction protein with cAMP-binding, CBS, and nucleotidyltransferase domain
MRIRVLKSVPLLSSLSDNQLDAVSHELCVECFAEGDHIVREGDPGTCFYLINAGVVKV